MTLAKVTIDFSYNLTNLRFFFLLFCLRHVGRVNQFVGLTLDVKLKAEVTLEDLV